MSNVIDVKPRTMLIAGVMLILSTAASAAEQTADQPMPDPQARLSEWFSNADQNDDGQLNAAEFEAAERPAGPHHGQRHHARAQHRERMQRRHHARRGHRGDVQSELFAILDADGDGALSKEEFSAGNRDTHRLAMKRASFKRLDRNADGALSLEEMEALRRGMQRRHGG